MTNKRAVEIVAVAEAPVFRERVVSLNRGKRKLLVTRKEERGFAIVVQKPTRSRRTVILRSSLSEKRV